MDTRLMLTINYYNNYWYSSGHVYGSEIEASLLHSVDEI